MDTRKSIAYVCDFLRMFLNNELNITQIHYRQTTMHSTQPLRG
jgi:hypothetical protein